MKRKAEVAAEGKKPVKKRSKNSTSLSLFVSLPVLLHDFCLQVRRSTGGAGVGVLDVEDLKS